MHAAPAPRPPLPNVMQLRLTDVQRRYTVLQAHRRGVARSDIVRELIDMAIDAAPPLRIEGEEGPARTRSRVPLRIVLQGMDDAALEELAAREADASS